MKSKTQFIHTKNHQMRKNNWGKAIDFSDGFSGFVDNNEQLPLAFGTSDNYGNRSDENEAQHRVTEGSVPWQ